jgi:hypothetical protein
MNNIKSFEIFTNENFNPGIVSKPAYWSTTQEAKMFLINQLKDDKTLTLSQLIKQWTPIINRMHKEGQDCFNEAVEQLKLPVWENPRNY